MTQIAGSIVLITGGASGIGKIMGRKSLEKGANQLIIWDINADMLDEVVAGFREKGFSATGFVVDVADSISVQQAARQVLQNIGAPHILINNAGIVAGNQLFQEYTIAEIEHTIAINTIGPMLVTQAFLPAMVARGNGHVVNIASAAGLMPNPRMSVYAASKWAIVGWSESLRLELEQQNYNLHVTTVTPGYINTGMFDGVKAPFLTPILEPESIAGAVLDAVAANKIFLRKPAIVHLLPLLRGLLPARLFDLIAGRFFNVYNSMDKFTGRSTRVISEPKDHTPTT